MKILMILTCTMITFCGVFVFNMCEFYRIRKQKKR